MSSPNLDNLKSLIHHSTNQEISLTSQNLTTKNLSSLTPYFVANKHCDKIDLSNNLLTYIPPPFATVSRIKSLDLSGNKFRDIRETAEVLSCMVSLEELFIDIDNDEEEYLIKEIVKGLGVLNGVRIGSGHHGREVFNTLEHDKCLPKNQAPVHSDTKIDFEPVEELFTSIKLLKSKANTSTIESQKNLEEKFDNHSRSVVSRLSSRIGNLDVTDIPAYDALQMSEVLLAKHGIYDIANQEITSFTSSELKLPELAQVMRRMRSIHTELFQNVPLIVQTAILNSRGFYEDKILGLEESFTNEINTLREEVDRREGETS